MTNEITIQSHHGLLDIYVKSGYKTSVGFFKVLFLTDYYSQIVNNLSPKLTTLIITANSQKYQIRDIDGGTIVIAEVEFAEIVKCIQEKVETITYKTPHNNLIITKIKENDTSLELDEIIELYKEWYYKRTLAIPTENVLRNFMQNYYPDVVRYVNCDKMDFFEAMEKVYKYYNT